MEEGRAGGEVRGYWWRDRSRCRIVVSIETYSHPTRQEGQTKETQNNLTPIGCEIQWDDNPPLYEWNKRSLRKDPKRSEIYKSEERWEV